MRTLFLTLGLVILCSSAALASPFLVSDSYTAPAVLPDTFRVALDGTPDALSPPWTGTLPDGTTRTAALHFDLTAVSVGPHTLTVRACKAATVWGPEMCSAATPFGFTRPADGAAPVGVTGMSLTR